MAARVRIPTPLRPLVGGRAEIEVECGSVGEVLDSLEAKHAGFKSRICDESGDIRRFINLFVNEEGIRQLEGLETPVKEGDVISIIPAIAGGTTWEDWHGELRHSMAETTPREVHAGADKKAIVIDVRESDEFREGHIPGAIHIPRGFLELRIESKVPDKGSAIVLHCAGGVRSLLAAETLQKLGYTDVKSMAGGYAKWIEEALPFEKPVVLSEADRRRYSRHLAIPEVGEEGQLKLLESKVLMIGAGGLGCPAAIYLVAAGVGTLGIVDFDDVDESNLQRQILHSTDRVGTSKIESATAALKAQNPNVNIVPFEERLTSENVERIFAEFDIVVDGSDNFPTRYLINDACVLLRKPCVHGSVYRFEGQVSVFDTGRGGPCYRCVYPEPPPPEMAPSCAEAGVLGVLPGVIGLLQAVETVKLILGKGDPLVGRLLCYDALTVDFRQFTQPRNPDCAYCGEGKEFPGFVDYEFFCANPSQ